MNLELICCSKEYLFKKVISGCEGVSSIEETEHKLAVSSFDGKYVPTDFAAFMLWLMSTELYLHILRSFDRISDSPQSILSIENKITDLSQQLLDLSVSDCLICCATPHFPSDLLRLAIYQFKKRQVYILKRTSINKLITVEKVSGGSVSGPPISRRVTELKNSITDVMRELSVWEQYSNSIIKPKSSGAKAKIKRALSFFSTRNSVKSLNAYYKLKSEIRSRCSSDLDRVVDDSKICVFVALHYQPERTSSPEGGLLYSQKMLIHITSSLFSDGIILVKDHPRAIAPALPRSRSLNFIKGHAIFENYPENVVWTNADVSSLLQLADVVVSLNGTVLFDAIKKQKPVISSPYWWGRKFLGVRTFACDGLPQDFSLGSAASLHKHLVAFSDYCIDGDVSQVFTSNKADFESICLEIIEDLSNGS